MIKLNKNKLQTNWRFIVRTWKFVKIEEFT